MSTTMRRATALFVAVGGLGLALGAMAAPAPTDITKTVKDRKHFIPYRKYEPRASKVVGVLIGDVREKMGQEGRSGPADAMGFSVSGNSYNWVYVPVEDSPLITNLRVKVGEKGDRVQVYPKLSMANPQTVRRWNVTGPFALVEIEVNDGQGAPADEGFVATRMTRLDGTKDYPLDVAKAIEKLRKQYADWKTEQKRAIDTWMTKAQKEALEDRKPTGPRETADLFYVTWLPVEKRLRVHFRTTVSDGDYKYGGGAEFDRPMPFELPPPPRPGKPAPPVAPPGPPGVDRSPALLRPPPRELPRVRFGTSFGVEFGMAYEIDKDGKVVRTLTLPPESFKKVLPPPPGIRPIRPTDPVPPRVPPRKPPGRD